MNESDDAGDDLAASDGCPNLDRCPMFPLFTQRAILNIYKQQYCHSHHKRCARFTTMMSGTRPPDNLLPDGTTLPVF